MNIFVVARWRDNKYRFFRIRYFLKMKGKPAEKIHGDIFLFNWKPFKNSGTFEEKKRQKKYKIINYHGFALTPSINYCCTIFQNLF